MNSFRNSLKSKGKNTADLGTKISNFKIEVNYINSNRNSIGSFKNMNVNNVSNIDGHYAENELSYLSNFKFDNNRSFSKLNSSIINKVNVQPTKHSYICSSISNTNIRKFISSIENHNNNKVKKLKKFLSIKNDRLQRKTTSNTPKAKENPRFKRKSIFKKICG